MRSVKCLLENFAVGDLNKNVTLNYLNETSSSTIRSLNIESEYFKKKEKFFGKLINKKYQVKYKDLDINNLYIGDISVLQSSWGGSTSFPALTTGYIAATYATEDK